MRTVYVFLLGIISGLTLFTFIYTIFTQDASSRLKRFVINIIKTNDDANFASLTCFESISRHLRNPNFNKPFIQSLTTPLLVSQLPEQCRQHFTIYPIPKNTSKSSIKCLHHRVFNATENAEIVWSLGHIKKLLEDNNITYLLSGGSVIASYRHHSRMPYDDDYDIRLYRPHKAKAKKLLHDLMKRNNTFYFEDCEKTRGWDHFHVRLGLRFRNKKEIRQLTAIDFFDYTITKDKFITRDRGAIPKSIFLPAIKRPLNGILFDAPRNFSRYFKYYYKGHNITHCYVRNHSTYKGSCGKPLPCKYFRDVIPFVVKFTIELGTLEAQTLNHTILSVFFQPKMKKL